MLYRNNTETTLGIKTPLGSVRVGPGQEVAIAPVVAKPYLDVGQLVDASEPVSKPEEEGKDSEADEASSKRSRRAAKEAE